MTNSDNQASTTKSRNTTVNRTPEEWRQACQRPDWSDADAAEFGEGLKRFVTQFLDAYFRDEYLPDDV